MKKIKLLSIRHSAFYTPYLIMMAGNYLKHEGFDYQYEIAGSVADMTRRLQCGESHVSQSAVAAGFSGLVPGQHSDIVHFAQINARDGFFIASREAYSDFKWHDLIGKRVLVDHFFQPLAMLKFGLHEQGVAYSSILAIDAGPVPEIERAFREGQADFVHLQGPAPQQLAAEGKAHVVAAVGSAVGSVAFSSLCAQRKWLQTDEAFAFVRAYEKASHYTVNSPAAEVASCLHDANFLADISLAVLTETIAAYQALGCWHANPLISKQEFERLLDVFQFNGLLTSRVPYDQLVVSPPRA